MTIEIIVNNSIDNIKIISSDKLYNKYGSRDFLKFSISDNECYASDKYIFIAIDDLSIDNLINECQKYKNRGKD